MPPIVNGIGVETRRGRFYASTPFGLKDALKTLAGHRWHKAEKMWSWPASPRSAKALDYRFRMHAKDGYGMDETFSKILEYVNAGNYCTNWLKKGLELPPIPKCVEEPKHWICQRQAFWHAVERFGGLGDHARGGATLELDMGCVDSETEFLSPEGWKKIEDWNSEPVAQVDKETGVATFVIPERYIRKPAGSMYLVRHGYDVNFVVSGDHKMALKKRSSRPGGWTGYEATFDEVLEDLETKNHTRAKYIRDEFRLDAVRPTIRLNDSELRLMVAVMADGYFRNKTDSRCVIRIKKGRKKVRLEDLLGRCGIEFNKRERLPAGFHAYDFIAPLKIKHYPADWYELASTKQARIICDECMHWDGCLSTGVFFSKAYEDCEFIQWCFAVNGFTASIKHDGRMDCGCWRVTVREKNNRCFTEKNISEFIPRDGMQYCFTVPSGFFVIRREGSISVTGNCGKTRVTYDLAANFGWWRTLVFCPAKVIPTWEKNYPRWCAAEMKIVALPTKWKMAKRAEAILQVTQFQALPTLVVLNYEALDHKVIKDALAAIKWNAIVLDEGHRIKDPNGTRSKFLGGDHKSNGLGDLAECRLELTGTFLPNGPLDAYGQARFIDATHWGYSFSRYRSLYAVLAPTGVGGPMVVVKGYQNEEDLGRHLSEFSIQVDAEDTEQDLPGEHHIDVPVELDDATREVYEQMKHDFVVFIDEDEEVTAANVLVKIGKLQEISGGFLRNPETKSLSQIGTEKADAAKEIMEDLPPNESIVVACRLRPDLDKLHAVAKSLGRKSYEVSGRINQLEDWQKSDGNEVLIAQIAAAKEGVDLGRSRWCIFYSLGYQPGEFRQFKKRQNRPGEHGEKRWDTRITFFHLVARDTVDEDIYEAITTKGNVIDFVKRIAKRG